MYQGDSLSTTRGPPQSNAFLVFTRFIMPRKLPKQPVVQSAVEAMTDATATGSGSGDTAHSTVPVPHAQVGRGSGAAQSNVGAHTSTVGAYPLTGVGPSNGIAASAVTQRPMHTGKKEDFPVFDVTFKSYLRIIGLHQVLSQDNPDANENARVFDELILALDAQSIKLVMNVTEEDGKLAYDTLKQKYKGDALQRKTNAINELVNLQMKPGENFQQLESRVDGIKKTIDSYKILNNDSIIVAAYAKCLPKEMETFTAMTFHGGLPSYAAFKLSLHNYLTHSNYSETKTTSVMSVNSGKQQFFIKKNKQTKKNFRSKPRCKACLKIGHYSSECNSKVYCKICRNKNHHTNNCNRGGQQVPSGTTRGFPSGGATARDDDGRTGKASGSSSNGGSFYPHRRRRSQSAGPSTTASTSGGGKQCG